MSRWFYASLGFAPAAIAGHLLGWAPILVFALSGIALIPLAGLIGRATEELAAHLGPRFGGLLNATFGNAAELIITILALRQGLTQLVQASIAGSILGNTLLVLGTAFVIGGARHGSQRFDARASGVSAAMMILAIAGLYVPAAVAGGQPGVSAIEDLSLLVAGVLLTSYALYLLYLLLDQRSLRSERPPSGGALDDEGRGSIKDAPVWGVMHSLLVLAGATAGAALDSEVLVNVVEPATRELGVNHLFVGAIIVPILGNAAEHYSAIVMAWKNRIDGTLGITAGSSIQIATLVAPVLVFAGPLLGHPLNLVFTPIEGVLLGLATGIFGYLTIDGRSNWLEGVQLLAVYIMAAMGFLFAAPGP